jgi:uncharacterized repeat protein (TIGR02543 family)
MNKNGGVWNWEVGEMTTYTYHDGGSGQDMYAGLPYGYEFIPASGILKEGSSFQGWFTDAAMTAANKVNGSITINNNTTNLYAKWQAEPNMQIKFLYHKNSSTSSVPFATVSVPYNAKITRPADNPPPWKTVSGMSVWQDPFTHWSLRNTTDAWDFNTRVNPTQSYWTTAGGYYFVANYAD